MSSFNYARSRLAGNWSHNQLTKASPSPAAGPFAVTGLEFKAGREGGREGGRKGGREGHRAVYIRRAVIKSLQMFFYICRLENAPEQKNIMNMQDDKEVSSKKSPSLSSNCAKLWHVACFFQRPTCSFISFIFFLIKCSFALPTVTQTHTYTHTHTRGPVRQRQVVLTKGN